MSVSLILALVLSLMAAFAPPVAGEKKPILIGHLHPFTGPFAMVGTACAIGIDVAIDEINISSKKRATSTIDLCKILVKTKSYVLTENIASTREFNPWNKKNQHNFASS